MKITAKVSAMIGMELVELPGVPAGMDDEKPDCAAIARQLMDNGGVVVSSKDDLGTLMFGAELLRQASRICDERNAASGTKVDGACGRGVVKKNAAGLYAYVVAELHFSRATAAYFGRVHTDYSRIIETTTEAVRAETIEAAEELALLLAGLMWRIGQTSANGRFFGVDDKYGYFAKAREACDLEKRSEK